MPKKLLVPKNLTDDAVFWGIQGAQAAASGSRYEQFKQTYRDNPVAFVHDCIDWRSGEPGPTFYQDEILAAIPLHRRVAVRGPHGLGKCIPYTSSMRLADGSLVEAKDLIGKTFEVLAVDADLNVQIAKAFAWDNGVRDVVEIVTDKGRTIRRTLNHPLWGDNEPVNFSKPEWAQRLRPKGRWIDAGKVRIGAAVAVYLGDSEREPYPISDDEIKIAAYLLGDGCVSKESFSITQAEGASLDEIREVCRALGAELHRSTGADYRIVSQQERIPGRRGWHKCHRLRRLVESWGMFGKNAHTKCFPSWVWNLDERQLALFLSRLYACDGWATAKPRTDGKVNKEIGYTSVSEQLAKDVSAALLRLGIHAETRKKRTRWCHKLEWKVGEAYSVNLHDAKNILLFCQNVGIFSKEEAVAQVKAMCEACSTKEQQKWRHHALPEHLAWERVTEIRRLPAEPTVAITVPGYETFLTEFVEHNTTTESWVALWFALVSDGEDWKAPTTASVWRQLQKFLWPEIKKWARRLKWTKIGRPPFDSRTELLSLNLKLRTGEAFAVASDNHTAIEGAHADRMLYMFDESKAISAATFDAAEGAFSGAGGDTVNEAFALAMSTPGAPVGRFYEIHAKRPGLTDWWTRHVTVDEAIKAKRISSEWVEARRLQWGETSSVFQNRVLGEFAADASDAVVPLAWIEAANERWRTVTELVKAGEIALPPLAGVGVDVARGGEDQSVIALRFGQYVEQPRRFTTGDTMQLAGMVNGILDVHETGKAMVDVIGVGAGVVDRLREGRHKRRIIGFNAGEGTAFRDKSGELEFLNKRSAAWWNLRELLDPTGGEDVMLPPDDMLTGDLVAPKWRMSSGGKIQIESKEDLRKPERLGRSTDTGDAVIQAFADVIGDPEPGIIGAYRNAVRNRGKMGVIDDDD